MRCHQPHEVLSTGSALTGTAMQDMMQHQFSPDGSNAREAEDSNVLCSFSRIMKVIIYIIVYIPCTTAVVSYKRFLLVYCTQNCLHTDWPD